MRIKVCLEVIPAELISNCCSLIKWIFFLIFIQTYELENKGTAPKSPSQ
jgi:hypothetical protein